MKAEIERLNLQVQLLAAERDNLRAALVAKVEQAGDSAVRKSPQRVAERDLAPLSPERHYNPGNEGQEGNGHSRSLPPAWLRLPHHTPPTCALDDLLNDLELLTQRLGTRDLQIPELLSPTMPVVPALADAYERNPLSPTSDGSICSVLITHVWMGMTCKSLVQRFAGLWVLFNLLRWRLCPSRETLDALPAFLVPTQLQLRTPHARWIDTIPWPEARDRIIQELPPGRYRRFREMLNEAVVTRWENSPTDCLLDMGPLGGYALTSEFKERLADLKNWSMTEEAVHEFPWLRGAVNITPREP